MTLAQHIAVFKHEMPADKEKEKQPQTKRKIDLNNQNPASHVSLIRTGSLSLTATSASFMFLKPSDDLLVLIPCLSPMIASPPEDLSRNNGSLLTLAGQKNQRNQGFLVYLL